VHIKLNLNKTCIKYQCECTLTRSNEYIAALRSNKYVTQAIDEFLFLFPILWLFAYKLLFSLFEVPPLLLDIMKSSRRNMSSS
jgi:hypothetical protein